MQRIMSLVMMVVLLAGLMPASSYAASSIKKAPVVISPVNGIRTTNGLWPTLQWKNGANTTSPYGYRIQVSTSSSFGSLVVDECVLSTKYLPTNTNWMRSQTGTHYWRVNYVSRAWSSQSACKTTTIAANLWSEVRSFVNVKPQNKILAKSPANGYTTTNQLWPTLSWSAGNFMTNYYRYGYRILVWKSTSSGWVTLVDECTTSTSYRPSSNAWMRSQTGTLQWRIFYVEAPWNGSQLKCKSQGVVASLGSNARIFYNPVR
jgi:hypothetical protein